MKDYYQTEGINASTLKLFAGDFFSPTVALHKMRNPSPPTQAMSLGTAVHSILEHEMATEEAYEVISEAYKTEKAREPVFNKACAMAHNVWTECGDIVQSPYANREQAHFTDDGFKALVDLEVKAVGYDYKTTRCTTLEDCIRDAQKYCLDVQAWHYYKVTGLRGFEFIFVSSVEPHPVFHIKCSDDYLHDFARPRWEEALARHHTFKDMEIPLKEEGVMEIPSWYSPAPKEDFSCFDEPTRGAVRPGWVK